MAAFALVITVLSLRSQRRIHEALRQLAVGLGWIEVRKPWLTLVLSVVGTWNGRRVALHYKPASKNSPAYIAAEISLPLTGRFELRACPEKESPFDRPIVLFKPPVIELFDPSNAASFQAWGEDRTTVERLLAVPGIRDLLARNLREGRGVLRLKKGTFRIRRPSSSPARRFPLGPSPDWVVEIAREQWDLIAAASALG